MSRRPSPPPRPCPRRKTFAPDLSVPSAGISLERVRALAAGRVMRRARAAERAHRRGASDPGPLRPSVRRLAVLGSRLLRAAHGRSPAAGMHALWAAFRALGNRAVRLPPASNDDAPPAGYLVWCEGKKLLPPEPPRPTLADGTPVVRFAGSWPTRLTPHLSTEELAELVIKNAECPEPYHFIWQIARIPCGRTFTLVSCAQLAYNVGQLEGWLAGVASDAEAEQCRAFLRGLSADMRRRTLGEFIEPENAAVWPYGRMARHPRWRAMLRSLHRLAR